MSYELTKDAISEVVDEVAGINIMRQALIYELRRPVASISSTGFILSYDDFEKGLGAWRGLAGIEPAWSDEQQFSGIGSMKLMTLEDYPSWTTVAIRRQQYQTPGKYGFECWWVYKATDESYIRDIGFSWDIDNGSVRRLWPEIRYVVLEGGNWIRKWKYNSGTATTIIKTDIPGQDNLDRPAWNTPWKYNWNHIKFVIDIENLMYDYMTLNGVTVDMSNLPIITETSATALPRILNAMVWIRGNHRCWMFVDEPVITMEEP